MTTFLASGAKGLISAQRWIMFICCACVIIGLFAQVILRYVFETTMLGLSELILIPTLWMYFIGASYASAQRTHISADVLQSYIRNRRVKGAIRAIVAVISVAIGLILSWWAFLYVEHGLSRPKSTSVYEIPLITVQVAVLVGFVLMTFYTAVNLFSEITTLRTGSAERSESVDVEASAEGINAYEEKEN
ncbi:TRAP transporter small permease [Brevibacterium sp. RIT 803]|uniref:TRAP transporter small permease n=1 Tax=Brevibacterium sp. RIT 803 TaxID=2810210 RepID=UPI001950A397|nr:TRAP transporter small permease [Brevibacterium sp. RIT 803]MBM6590583.1 TRAP transporter small permease [Brevibacterium sp. RIT 803]